MSDDSPPLVVVTDVTAKTGCGILKRAPQAWYEANGAKPPPEPEP